MVAVVAMVNGDSGDGTNDSYGGDDGSRDNNSDFGGSFEVRILILCNI